MAMKTKMLRHITTSIKNKLIKNKRCEYCESGFSSSNDYLCHVSIHPTQILPNLYVGNKDNAKDIKLLNKIGITHILYISYSSYSSIISPQNDKQDDNFSSLHFVGIKQINIISDQNLTRYFNESFIFIDYALNNNFNKYKVLIFCEFGVSISPCFSIAYLMYHCNLSLITSYNIIKSKRNIDISKYMKQLKIYQQKHCHTNMNINHKKWQLTQNNKIYNYGF
eukprot:UN02701